MRTPWVSAVMDARFLPASDFGPVDFWALMRLMFLRSARDRPMMLARFGDLGQLCNLGKLPIDHYLRRRRNRPKFLQIFPEWSRDSVLQRDAAMEGEARRRAVSPGR